MDIDWLKSIGVETSQREFEELSRMLADELELRVGRAVAEQLTQKELDEFEALMDDGNFNEDDRFDWLEKAYPGYKLEVEQETSALMAEILRSRDVITYIYSL